MKTKKQNQKTVVFEDLPKGWQDAIIQIADATPKHSTVGIWFSISRKALRIRIDVIDTQFGRIIWFAIKDAKERGII